MTAASGDQLPPEENENQGQTAQADPSVPEPREEFLRATRQLMRGSRALITGGSGGIGRVIAVGLAKEGVDVAIAYSPDEPDEDAMRTATLVEQELALLGHPARRRSRRGGEAGDRGRPGSRPRRCGGLSCQPSCQPGPVRHH